MSCLAAGVQVDKALVGASPEPQGNVLEFFHKPPVHQHVQQREHLIRHLAAGMGAVGGQLLIGKAAEAPDGLVGVRGPDPVQKGHQAPLVLRLEGFSSQQRQPVDIAGGEQVQERCLRLFREGLAVVKGPGLGLKAVFAVVGAAGDEQRHPDPFTVGDVTVFDLSVIHHGLLSKSPRREDVGCFENWGNFTDAAPGPGSPGCGPGSRTAYRYSRRSDGPRSSCPGRCCRTWGTSR